MSQATKRNRDSRAQMMSLDGIRTPPHNTDAEKCVLGALLLDERTYEPVSLLVNDEDFYRNDNRVIFRAIDTLRRNNKPADVITVGEWLEQNDLLEEAGGMEYVVSLAKDAPGGANAKHYAGMVKQHAALRALIQQAGDIIQQAYSGADAAEVIADAHRRILRMDQAQSRRGGQSVTLSTAMRQAIDTLDEMAAGKAPDTVTTGLVDLDRVIGGYHAGDLCVIAARPAMGKTGFMINSAYQCKKPVGIISSEQPNDQIALRVLSSENRINLRKLRTAELQQHEWAKIASSISRLARDDIFINDKPGITIAEIERQARAWKSEHNIGILFVDYLQKINGGEGEKRHEQVGDIARRLKNLARDLSIPVVPLAQVNRTVEQRPDKRPYMSDIKDCGEIEQEADSVITIYRDAVYHPNASDANEVEFGVCKNRHGPTCVIQAVWFGEYVKFENLAKETR